VRRTRVRTLLGVTAVAVVGLLVWPAAAASPAVTFTESEQFTESFSDGFLCQTERYSLTVSGRTSTHLTARTNANGNIVPPLRFHELVRATVVAVPLDGTGVSYVARFRTSDSETIRSVKHGDTFAETDTDQNKVIAKGSDGSRATLYEHQHFTVNANGDVSIEFDKVRATC
jgi:hypothetical protein